MTSTTAKGPDCDMCLARVRKATRAVFFRVFDTDHQVNLCNAHQQRFLEDMSPWIRVATVVENSGVPRPRASQPMFTDEHTQRIRELKERAAERAEKRTVIVAPNSRPSAPDEWRISTHAHERARERGFSAEKVIAAASDAQTTYPEHRRGPDFECRMRAGCYVVVNKVNKEIITVMDRMMFEIDRESFRDAVASA